MPEIIEFVASLQCDRCGSYEFLGKYKSFLKKRAFVLCRECGEVLGAHLATEETTET